MPSSNDVFLNDVSLHIRNDVSLNIDASLRRLAWGGALRSMAQGSFHVAVSPAVQDRQKSAPEFAALASRPQVAARAHSTTRGIWRGGTAACACLGSPQDELFRQFDADA